MEQGMLASLSAWESFYVIIGPSAAVLIGLQFVVIVMSAELRALRSNAAVSTFGTPTIIHFSVVLFVSAMLTAPWPAMLYIAALLGICGVAGVLYAAIISWRARRQTGYKPVLEDWVWHSVLPLVSYTALLFAAVELQSYSLLSMFVVGATMLLLLFIGIHNSWDTVVYIALQQRERESQNQQ